MHKILNGLTDSEIITTVKVEFDIELAHSSFNRWRKAAGEELAERYKAKRFLVRSFVEKLKNEGIEVKDDKYSQIIQNLEDHLLTSERELIEQNPLKLLHARQDDERLKLQREKLELQRSQLEFEREKHQNSVDRVQIGADTMTDFIEYADSDIEIIQLLTKHLKPFGEHLKAKYAEAN